MRVLAFRHSPLEGLGSIAAALERHHIECRTVDSCQRTGPVPDLAGAAGLILMGGSMSANDDLPWLRDEMDAIREAASRGMPVLGICLGAQLIAKALGARVYRNPVKEIGWAPVYWTEEAAGDPLLGGLDSPETPFHWHAETFDLPEGAAHLAYSDACRNQAFRAAGNAYGLQFHIEVMPQIIEDWIRYDESCGSAREMEGPIDPRANAARMAEVSAKVFDRWCGLLRR